MGRAVLLIALALAGCATAPPLGAPAVSAPDLRGSWTGTWLNAQLRKVNKKRGAFPNPESVRKVLYLAIMKASERWSRPVQDWTAALNHFALVFPDRVPA
jgi:hypothetical protein